MIDKLEQLHEQICDECQEGLYYPPKEYQESSQRIFNAETMLYNEAIRIYRDKSKQGKITKLTLNQLVKVMSKIYEILRQAENWKNKESMIKDILEKNNMASANFLKLDSWQGDFLESMEE